MSTRQRALVFLLLACLALAAAAYCALGIAMAGSFAAASASAAEADGHRVAATRWLLGAVTCLAAAVILLFGAWRARLRS